MQNSNSKLSVQALPENSELPTERQVCTRITNKMFCNVETGELHRISCKAYACEVCGERKRYRLFKALRAWLSEQKVIRMWTFTLTTRYASSSLEHRLQLQKCWHFFMRDLRRCSLLSESVRQFQYVRVSEWHSEYVRNSNEKKRVRGMHYHCFFTEYINWHLVNAIWEKSAKKVLAEFAEREKSTTANSLVLGHVNVRSSNLTASKAAGYVCKYVMKQIADSKQMIRRWSKSGRTGIFLKPSVGLTKKYFVVDVSIHHTLNLKPLSTSAHEFSDLPYSLMLFEFPNVRDDIPDKAKEMYKTVIDVFAD